MAGEKYCLFDLGLAYAGRRNARESLRYAQQMQDFANRTGVSLDHGLANNISALGLIVHRDWQAALDASQKLLEIYQEANKEICIPAVLNMLGIAYLGLGKPDEASNYFQSGLMKAMDLEHPPYASRCAFNLTWTLYQRERPDEALAVIGKSKDLSKEIRELGSIDALSRAVEAYKSGDISSEAQALLDCARVSQDNIDLWDPCDIAVKARELAQVGKLYDLKVEAQSFIDAFNARLVPPE